MLSLRNVPGVASPETPGNAASGCIKGICLVFLGDGYAPSSWPDSYALSLGGWPSLSAGDSCFPLSPPRGSCILSQGYAPSPTNARPHTFPSLTQCLQEDFRFLPCHLFLTPGLSPCLSLSCSQICSIVELELGGRVCLGRLREAGPLAAGTCDKREVPLLRAVSPHNPHPALIPHFRHTSSISSAIFLILLFPLCILSSSHLLSLLLCPLPCFPACFIPLSPVATQRGAVGSPDPSPFSLSHLSPLGLWLDLTWTQGSHCSFLCVGSVF